MAKKSRRARRGKPKQRRPSVPPPVPPPTAIPATVLRERQQAVATVSAPGTLRTQLDFAEQYGYVRQDLRRIALLAGSIFTVLIILSFVLR